MKKISVWDNKLKEKSGRIINPDRLEPYYSELNLIFDNERVKLCDLFDALQFSRITKRTKLIKYLDSCFELTKDHERKNEAKRMKLKEDLFDILQSKLTNENARLSDIKG